jgi:hypothetical protein
MARESGHEHLRMKAVLRRLQQLEQRHSELIAADFSSGARERLLARISQMADPRRMDQNREPPSASVSELRRRVLEAVASDHEARP